MEHIKKTNKYNKIVGRSTTTANTKLKQKKNAIEIEQINKRTKH